MKSRNKNILGIEFRLSSLRSGLHFYNTLHATKGMYIIALGWGNTHLSNGYPKVGAKFHSLNGRREAFIIWVGYFKFYVKFR